MPRNPQHIADAPRPARQPSTKMPSSVKPKVVDRKEALKYARELAQIDPEAANASRESLRGAFPACPLEDDEQIELFSIIDRYIDKHPQLACIFSIPNGARTSIRTAVKLKATGLRKGVPDIFVAVPLGRSGGQYFYDGLFIEMKRVHGGRIAPAQKIWHERLRRHGYKVEVCKGAEAAWSTICDYLGIETGEIE